GSQPFVPSTPPSARSAHEAATSARRARGHRAKARHALSQHEGRRLSSGEGAHQAGPGRNPGTRRRYHRRVERSPPRYGTHFWGKAGPSSSVSFPLWQKDGRARYASREILDRHRLLSSHGWKQMSTWKILLEPSSAYLEATWSACSCDEGYCEARRRKQS
ncbi:unnamed protein product, partial [Prorocentrum cordatum]